MESKPRSVGHLKVVHDDERRAAATTAFRGDDPSFLRALREREPAATAALFDANQSSVLAVLARILGVDSELRDLLQEVFLRALRGVHTVRDGRVVQQWLRQIAVCTAMDCLRRRRRRRWLRYVAPEDLDEPPVAPVDSEGRDAVRRVYRILEDFPAEERVAFTLRLFAGMELTEVAAATSCSLATVKRRLSRAEDRFTTAARGDAVLGLWIEKGNRWQGP